MEIKKIFYKSVENYRNGFKYLLAKLEKLEVSKRKQAEKLILRYYENASRIKMTPQPQDLLDLVNEIIYDPTNEKG
jgi:hypothetical protein